MFVIIIKNKTKQLFIALGTLLFIPIDTGSAGSSNNIKPDLTVNIDK